MISLVQHTLTQIEIHLFFVLFTYTTCSSYFIALPTNIERETVRNILSFVTEFLCDNLEPTRVIRRLQTEGALSDSDVENIKREENRESKVNRLLNILKMKPVNAYHTFMESLKTFDSELHKGIMEILQGKLMYYYYLVRQSSQLKKILCRGFVEPGHKLLFEKFINSSTLSWF